MAVNPWEFLDKWADDNVHATVFDDAATAKTLASSCLQDARTAGINAASVIRAAGGDLESFMLDRLNSAVNAELDRVVAKDKS
jgi:hypothetical protein